MNRDMKEPEMGVQLLLPEYTWEENQWGNIEQQPIPLAPFFTEML